MKYDEKLSIHIILNLFVQNTLAIIDCSDYINFEVSINDLHTYF